MIDAVPIVRQQVVLGHSVQGRPIVAWRVGDPSSKHVTLVVGCIHGNEPAGIRIANDLVRDPPPKHTLLWIIPDLNPDGVAAGTRQNGHGVDLNRNFPWHWQALGQRSSTFYSGPASASEPETRIAMKLIRRVRPTISVWFHQHLDVVDESGGDARTELRFARLVKLPLARLPRYNGSAVSWENTRLPRTTSFVVELPAGPVPAGHVELFTSAIERTSRD